jgi:hypothetical protein
MIRILNSSLESEVKFYLQLWLQLKCRGAGVWVSEAAQWIDDRYSRHNDTEFFFISLEIFTWQAGKFELFHTGDGHSLKQLAKVGFGPDWIDFKTFYFIFHSDNF